MNCIGLVTEGPSDQEVISNILIGFTSNKNLDINHVKPDRSANANRGIGGWGNLLNFLKTEDYRISYQTNEYIIIHIDTDVCDTPYINVSKLKDGHELPEGELIEVIKNKIINDFIGTSFFEMVKARTIFAICVHSIECWILPIFHSTNATQSNKTQNCLKTLNRSLNAKIGYTIDKKDHEFYNEITKDYRKNKYLKEAFNKNPSLRIFIDHLSNFEILCEE